MKSPLGLETKLPVGDLFNDAFSILWQKRADVIRLFLPVIILMSVLDFVSMTYFMPETESVQAPISFQALISQFILLVFTVLMATTAHRFTLQPRETWPTNALRMIGRNEVRYFVRLVLIALVSFATAIPIALIVRGMAGFPVAAFFAVTAALYVSGRLSVTLPEIALGKQTTLKRAWELGQGNGFRLVTVVVLVPMLMLFPLFAFMQMDSYLMRFIGTFAVYLWSLLSFTLLSLCYQFLHSFESKLESQEDKGEGQDQGTDQSENKTYESKPTQKSDDDSFDA